jgi:hypothetical protein
MGAAVLIVDSVTHIGERGAGQVIVCGSHGGRNSALRAAIVGARAIVLNDAGVGKDGAGISGLEPLAELGVAMAVVSHDSARIGDGEDTAANGRLSHLNRLAAAAGLSAGLDAAAAIELLRAWQPAAVATEVPEHADRPLREVAGLGPPTVVCDSMSQAGEEQAGMVVVSGSHGGDMGGRHAPAGLLAAFFNDAGVGKDRAGIARLPLLDEIGIAAATAGHFSARIGDGEDCLRSGVISHVNRHAAAAGLEPGTPVEAAVRSLAT